MILLWCGATRFLFLQPDIFKRMSAYKGSISQEDAVHLAYRTVCSDCRVLCVDDLNKGGIAAGVIIALLALGLLAFGLWYAHRKGYLPSEYSASLPFTIGSQLF